MGYGGQTTIDIAQTDVDAIVNGLTGTNGQTLTELEYRLSGIEGNLYYNGNSAGALLQWISDNLNYYLGGSGYGVLYDGNSAVSYLSWINSGIGNIDNYLYGNNYGVLNDGTYAVTYLNWIYGNTGSTASSLFDNYGNSAATLLEWINSNINSYLYDGYSAATYLNWISGYTSNTASYLWNGNLSLSVADLLADIRTVLQSLQFDSSGRLKVTTT